MTERQSFQAVLKILALALLALTVAHCRPAGAATSPDSSGLDPTAASLPSDIQRLGHVTLAPPEDGVGAITAVEALSVASGEGYAWDDPDTYLVRMSGSANVVSTGVEDRLVWLIRWDDLEIDGSAPVTQDGSPAERPPLRYLYVTIDARSAEFVDATYME